MAHATIAGLQTATITINKAGPTGISCTLQLPLEVDGYGSQVVATVQQNSSTIFTSTAGQNGFFTTASCAVGDVITVALTSSATIDLGLNNVKATISIGSLV